MEDLAWAVTDPRNSLEQHYTGLRPGGEKRHELLMSGEEASRAVDLTGVSIVLPHLATWWEKSVWAHEPKAAPVLRSSQFAEQLSVPELRALLAEQCHRPIASARVLPIASRGPRLNAPRAYRSEPPPRNWPSFGCTGPGLRACEIRHSPLVQ